MDRVAGVDEAGRGAWAGPVVAAAVLLRGPVPGLADSKTLSSEKRKKAFFRLAENASWAVGFADKEEIEARNIRLATFLAMQRAVAGLAIPLDKILVDGKETPEFPVAAEAWVDGDARHEAIMAASIIAKCTRDQYMQTLEHLYPGYGFARHKGYGTAWHRQALLALGPCRQHRLSFLKKVL